MSGKSEFARILDHLTGSDSAHDDRGKQVLQSEQLPNQGSKTSDFANDWISKIFFTQGPLKAQVFSAYRDNLGKKTAAKKDQAGSEREKFAQDKFRHQTQRPHDPIGMAAQPSQARVEPKSQAQGKTEEQVKVQAAASRHEPSKKQAPKIKRKMTFDQLQALKIFEKLSENEINEFSTDQELKLAYRKLAKRFHPDAGATDDGNFKIIAKAYQKLVD